MTTPQKLADLKALNRLLDHALELAPERIEPWFAKLPTQLTHLAPRLRQLLAEHHASKPTDFMVASPRLGDSAEELTIRPGDMAGPYRLLNELGRGGMCAVWLAERGCAGRSEQFAVKLPRRTPTPEVMRRLADERDITALMDHPHVARVRDAGNDSSQRPYLVLDCIQGQTLDTWCASKPRSEAQRLSVFVQLAHAVAYVHSRGVVHRDLKPANVLIDDAGQVHLLDFGIAARLRPLVPAASATRGERSLTPGYASPEQARGDTTTEQSDVYSLGVILFELLTGGRPSSPAHVAPLANVIGSLGNRPLELGDILCRALALRPEERQPSASALAQQIERVLRAAAMDAPIEGRSEGRWAAVAQGRVRNGLGVGLQGHLASPPRWN